MSQSDVLATLAFEQKSHWDSIRPSIPRHFRINLFAPGGDAAFDALEIFESLLSQEVQRLQRTYAGFARSVGHPWLTWSRASSPAERSSCKNETARVLARRDKLGRLFRAAEMPPSTAGTDARRYVQYLGTLESISSLHAVMPPLTLLRYLKPCCRRKFSAFNERTPALQCR